MTRTANLRTPLLLLIAWLILVSGCARLPDTRITPLKADTPANLQDYLLSHKPELDQFRLRGPFKVAEHTDYTVQLSATERIKADLYLSAPAEKAPLVIFLHGYDSSKEAHAYQAMHLASWGMHSLVLQLSRKGPWDKNGKILAQIANLLNRSPEIIDSRIDPNRIILVGHSFGGYAVTVAMAEGAAAAGGILLDPAIVGNSKPRFMQKINKPVMLLGADEEVSPARHRDFFFHFIRNGIAEISIKGAAHEDAQYPSEFSLNNYGLDPQTTEELQVTFVSALTASAFSLSATRSFDYAWKSFGNGFENDRFFNSKKK